MRLSLSQKWVDKLVNLPETGMGYQIVDVYLESGAIVRKILVINCEELVIHPPWTFFENDIQDICLSPQNKQA
ncbi:MAG: hypothetical protein HYT63_03255 [Candidatus Yanofskybacteria bacterium]|nr:hypothetical protein [Candidatus Yanofskybacteria bacterium]